MGFFDWLLRLFGLGRRDPSSSDSTPAPTPQPPRADAPPPAAPPPAPAPAAPPPPAGPAPSAAPAEQFTLGCVDSGVSQETCDAYEKFVKSLTTLDPTTIAGRDRFVTRKLADSAGAMSVAELQRHLKTLGLFPGGKADGIYGYRTQSAVRLFQEYVRSVEGQTLLPDGAFGRQTHAHLARWLQSGGQPMWTPNVAEHQAWLDLVGRTKQKYLAAPTRELQLVNAFPRASNTRKVADWVTEGDGRIHLIGVRRKEFSASRATAKFDDMFVLLIKGLVFKFQGTTDPGAVAAESRGVGAPHLTHGQHAYRFGWHKSRELALEPEDVGVLTVREGAEGRLDEADLDRGLSGPNASINIHWGGRGMRGMVGDFSHGCQSIAGTLYINPMDQLVTCPFAAKNNGELQANANLTRGAFATLADLVTALSGDMAGNTVNYTLLLEEDLALAPAMADRLADARRRALAAMGV